MDFILVFEGLFGGFELSEDFKRSPQLNHGL